ncbi:hypothetical protein N5D03_12950 [Empedobacter sp. GD03861]|nr:hypothetical protein [Empedobacter sp. GD03861]MDH0675447.1 hypothetical protein [Empedobacter sp. GD03861]
MIFRLGIYAQSLDALACNVLDIGDAGKIEAETFNFALRLDKTNFMS